MALVEPFTQLRTHLERCSILLDTLYNRREESCSEATLHVMSATDDIRNAITKTIKAAVAYKNDADVRFDFNGIKPAKVIHEKAEYPGDAEIIEAEMKEYAKPEPVKAVKTAKVYHPDPKLNKIIDTMVHMGGGLPLAKLIPKFKMEKPPMELWDIYGFVQDVKTLREKNGKVYETGVYTHLCEHGTVYVGIARMNHRSNGTASVEACVRQRLHDHRNWHESDTKANWTGFFRVLSMLFYFPGDKEDEDLMVQLLAACLPYTRVRGGQYTGVGDVSIPVLDVEVIKQKLMDKST